MNIKLLLIGGIMMASPLIVKFVPILIFLGPFIGIFVLCALIGFCIFAAGISQFQDIKTEDKQV